MGDIPGNVVMTTGIAALPQEQQEVVIGKVIGFDDFTNDNDPYGEHDFGCVDIEGVGGVYFKSDYYEPNLERGSEDPTDLTKTVRVMTIMLTSEY